MNPVSKFLQYMSVMLVLECVLVVLALATLVVAIPRLPWAAPAIVAILVGVMVLLTVTRAARRLARADLVPDNSDAHACRCIHCGENFVPVTPATVARPKGTPEFRRIQGRAMVVLGAGVLLAGIVTVPMGLGWFMPMIPLAFAGVLALMGLASIGFGVWRVRGATRSVGQHVHLCRWCGASCAQAAAGLTPVVAR